MTKRWNPETESVETVDTDKQVVLRAVIPTVPSLIIINVLLTAGYLIVSEETPGTILKHLNTLSLHDQNMLVLNGLFIEVFGFVTLLIFWKMKLSPKKSETD